MSLDRISHEICIGCSQYLNTPIKDTLQYLALYELLKTNSLCSMMKEIFNKDDIRKILWGKRGEFLDKSFRKDKTFYLVRRGPKCTSFSKVVFTIPFRYPCNRPADHEIQLVSEDQRIIKIFCCREKMFLDL